MHKSQNSVFCWSKKSENKANSKRIEIAHRLRNIIAYITKAYND